MEINFAGNDLTGYLDNPTDGEYLMERLPVIWILQYLKKRIENEK